MQNDESGKVQALLKRFSDPNAVKEYSNGVKRFLPGCDALHRMAGVLLSETAPQNAHILVLGAGGGLELKAFAGALPGSIPPLRC